MNLKDKFGQGITNFLYPYIQNYSRESGGSMPKLAMQNELYNLQERYLWFLGNEELLADFYATRTQSSLTIDTKSSYYYSNLDATMRIIHSGLPSFCSYAKSNLLQSGGMDYKVMMKEKEVEKETIVLEDILDDNDFRKQVTNMITTESWAGRFAVKISIDKEISEYPIIEKYSPLSYRAVYKRGRLQELIFIEKYDDGKFELHEHYGKGYVKYNLYKKTQHGLTEVNMNALPETADIVNVIIPNNQMWAMEKVANKSDYEGLIAEFDSLDETWSQLSDEIRNGRAETYVPDILMDNKQFNAFKKKYVVTGTDLRETAKSEITHNQPAIRTEEYTKAINAITNNILAGFGLSPITVGIDENTGANASGENIARREVVSLRTRKNMIETWEEFLEKLFLLLLNVHGIDKKEMYVEVKFGEYITPSRKEVIEEVKMLIDASIIDNEKALDDVYGDELSEEDKVRILTNNGNVTFEEEENTTE